MAIDVCEPQMIRALEKQGWLLRAKPYVLRPARRSVYADLLLHRESGRESQDIIVVEVKCYADRTQDLAELYTAIGQYTVYRTALERMGDPTPLYLAIPQDAFERLTDLYAADAVFHSIGAKLVIIDIEREEVVSWMIWEES